MNTFYRCAECKTELMAGNSHHDNGFLICDECESIGERVFMCSKCSEREAHPGCDDCFPCVLDRIIADPRYLEMCAPALQLEIGKALAERAKPTYSVGCLTRRQAS